MPGTYSSSAGASTYTMCAPCPSGTFSSAPGAMSAAACSNASKYACAVDADCDFPGCVQLPSPGPRRFACNAHDYTRPGSPANKCGWGFYRTACPAGYSCYNAGGGACTAGGCYLGTCPDPDFTCPAGTYSWVVCVLCPAGSYSSASGATSSAACVPCSAGSYSSGSGQFKSR